MWYVEKIVLEDLTLTNTFNRSYILFSLNFQYHFVLLKHNVLRHNTAKICDYFLTSTLCGNGMRLEISRNQKMKFYAKDFCSKCEQIPRKLRFC